MSMEQRNAVVLLRLPNKDFPLMSTVAVVGSRRADARRLGREELPEFLGKGYVVKMEEKKKTVKMAGFIQGPNTRV
jgi:hypothetical protein